MAQESLPSGEVKLSVRFPIDDNDRRADGRIYLKDTFVLSAEGRRVKSFSRLLEGGKSGPSSLWGRRLSDWRKAPTPGVVLQQKFVDQVFTEPELLKRLAKSPAAAEFMRLSGEAIQKGLGNDQLQIMGRLRGAFFKVEKSSGGFRIKLSWLVDDDQDSQNGRHIMEDTFQVDGKTFQFQSFQRRFLVHPDSLGNPEATMRLAGFYGLKKPSQSEARAFVEPMIPVLFSQGDGRAAPGEMAMREGSRTDPRLGTGDLHPVQGNAPEKTGQSKGKRGLPGLAGLGGSAPGAGPVVRGEQEVTPEAKKTRGVPLTFRFHRHPARDRTINRENIAGWLTRTVGMSLKSKLSKRGVPGTVKFDFRIQFDGASGYVTEIKAGLLQDRGIGLSSSDLKELMKDAAERIHLNFRAVSGLSGDIISVPMTFTITG